MLFGYAVDMGGCLIIGETASRLKRRSVEEIDELYELRENIYHYKTITLDVTELLYVSLGGVL